jgi:uncharacterized membrane protein YfcA
MSQPDRAAMAPDDALAATQHRGEHLAVLFGRARRFGVRLISPGLMLWLMLTGVSLFWIIVVWPDRVHGAAVMAAITMASIVSSIAGFAFSAICGAMLFHFHDDPVQVVQIMITCSIANQAAMTWAARREIDWRGLNVYFAGGAVGLWLGVWLLLHADRGLYTQAFGGFLLAYGVYMLLRKPVFIRRQPIAVDFVSGFLGGITGGAAGFPGAFVTIWCGMKGWDKARQRAVFQPFILVMQLAALLAIGMARRPGASGFGLDITDTLFVPASLFGTSVGLTLYRRLTDQQFSRAVNVLLIASGLSYLA